MPLHPTYLFLPFLCRYLWMANGITRRRAHVNNAMPRKNVRIGEEEIACLLAEVIFPSPIRKCLMHWMGAQSGKVTRNSTTCM